jgi:N-acetylneuraminic acid mutarotase
MESYWQLVDVIKVGGRDKGLNPSSAIHRYYPTTNSWDLISNMPTARWDSVVAVLPTDEVMVIGGSINMLGSTSHINKIEIADFNLAYYR